MPIAKLTQHFVSHELQCPVGKARIEYCDADMPGMYIEVRATSPGQGTYFLRYKNATGKTSHQKIGRTQVLSLADARKQAKILKADIALGADPRSEKKAQAAVPTFAEFFTEQYLPYVKPRKRSWAKDEEMFRLRLQTAFGGQRLNQITRQHIQTFHTGLKNQGLAAATCNHYLKLLKHAFNLAIDWGILETNPAVRIPMFHEDNKKENYLKGNELQRLLEHLRTDENKTVCQIVLFLLSTGARLNEAMSATWDNIDLEQRVWRIMASHSKSKRTRAVPLNDSALNILQQLDSQGRYAHLFINKLTEKPYTDISKAWGRMRIQTGLPHIRLHDLRHSYASGGQSLYTVQQILGHSDPSVTQRYSHLSTEPLREAANTTSQVIQNALSATR